MLQKVINYLKSLLISKDKVKIQTINNIYHSPILKKSIIFDIQLFKNLSQHDKVQVFYEMYENSAIVYSAVEYVVSSVLALPYYYYHPDKNIQDTIIYHLTHNKINTLIENIIRDYIIKGFALYQIYQEEEIKTQKIEVYDNIKDNFIKISNKYYHLSDFIFLSSPIPVLTTIIPLYNIVKTLEDSLFLNLTRFGIPYNIIKFKTNIDPSKVEEIEQILKNYYSKDISIPFLAYSENLLDYEFKTPENIIDDYINVYVLIEKIIYKVLGILPTISSDIGGSYAKAKVQENMFLRRISLMLTKTLEEINKKLLPKLFIYLNLDKYVIEDNLGYFSLSEDFENNLKLKILESEVKNNGQD